jgi:hypothetical protein
LTILVHFGWLDQPGGSCSREYFYPDMAGRLPFLPCQHLDHAQSLANQWEQVAIDAL